MFFTTVTSGRQRAAKKARIIVGTTSLSFASWNYNISGEDLPTTNFTSFGLTVAQNGVTAGPGLGVGPSQTFDEGIVGTIKAEYEGGGDWDAGTTPLGENAGDVNTESPGLFPRDDLGPLEFDQDRLDPGLFSMPVARIRTARTGAVMPGKVTFTFSGMNQGPFNVPLLNNTSVPDNG